MTPTVVRVHDADPRRPRLVARGPADWRRSATYVGASWWRPPWPTRGGRAREAAIAAMAATDGTGPIDFRFVADGQTLDVFISCDARADADGHRICRERRRPVDWKA